MSSSTILQSAFEGRQTQDPREYNAFKELADRVENLERAIRVNPDSNVGLGFDPVSDALAIDFFNETKRLGIGLPALTLTERNALSNPPARTIIYNKSFNCLSFFDGSIWKDIGSEFYSYGTAGSSTAGETELLGIDLPASFLAEVGRSIYWEFYGFTAVNGNNKQFKAYFDNTQIWDSGSLAANDVLTFIKGHIINIDNTNQFSVSYGQLGATLALAKNALAKTLTNVLRLSIKATAPTANNDAVGKSLLLRKNW